MNRDGLNTGTEVCTVVGGLPGTRDDIIARAASCCGDIGVSQYRRGITIIGGGGRSGKCREFGILAVDGPVGWAGDHRCSNIL